MSRKDEQAGRQSPEPARQSSAFKIPPIAARRTWHSSSDATSSPPPMLTRIDVRETGIPDAVVLANDSAYARLCPGFLRTSRADGYSVLLATAATLESSQYGVAIGRPSRSEIVPGR